MLCPFKHTIFIAFFVLTVNIYGQTLPVFHLTVKPNNTKGYYFLSAIKPGQKKPYYNAYHFILDGKGNIVYSKKFALGLSPGDFKLNSNGLISYYHLNKYMIMDSTFKIIDSVQIKNGYKEDGHAFKILNNGHYIILGIDEVQTNLSAYSHFNKINQRGSSNAIVRYGVIQEQDKNKNVVFEWHSKNFYDIKHIDSLYLNDISKINVPHINSIDVSQNGDLIISCRNFNEITKISKSTGNVLWRMGGKLNSFNFLNDSQKFQSQHAAVLLSDSDLILFDNGYEQPLHASSAKEYLLNEGKLQAKLIWKYVNNTQHFSIGLGNVQRLKNGYTLINYGIIKNTNLMFNVVDKNNNKVLEVTFADSLKTYRTFHYDEIPFKFKRPKINLVKTNNQYFLEADSGFKSYRWSNGSIEQKILIHANEKYFVAVPFGDGGELYSEVFYTKTNVDSIEEHSIKKDSKK